MAVDTNVSTLSGASSIGLTNNLRLYHRTIDFSEHNLASGAWFEIIRIPANSIILQGALYVQTGEATATLALGYGGGHELLDAANYAAATIVPFTHSNVAFTSADDVSIAAAGATADEYVVTVLLLVLETGGVVGQG